MKCCKFEDSVFFKMCVLFNYLSDPGSASAVLLFYADVWCIQQCFILGRWSLFTS